MGAHSRPGSCDGEYSPFASRTVTRHLLRGTAGVALVVLAFDVASNTPVVAIAAGLLAVIAFRGCPMCWTIGLVETIVDRARRRQSAVSVRPPSALRP